jgi:hypothetical protein
VASTCNHSYPEGRDQDCGSEPALAHSFRDPISAIPNIKRTGGLAHDIELLPSEHEALSSNPSSTKKKWCLSHISVAIFLGTPNSLPAHLYQRPAIHGQILDPMLKVLLCKRYDGGWEGLTFAVLSHVFS